MACIFLLAACGARGEDASQTNLMETLVSTNSYSRLSAVKELGAQRGQMIKDLMAILNRGCYKFWHNRLLSKCIGRKNVS